MTQKIWGEAEGQPVILATVENVFLRVKVSNYGAIIQSIQLKQFHDRDVVLGYDTVEEYANDDKYIGTLIGRTANRIGQGTFKIDGKTYQLALNNGPNNLHGGLSGFNRKIWTIESLNTTKITLRLVSPDCEEGYPGNLIVHFSVSVDNNRVVLSYQAVSDQDTIVNLSHHSYFNLHEDGTIVDHQLEIFSKLFAPIDEFGLSLSPPVSVTETPFDFNVKAKIADRIDQPHEQLRLGKGFDHHYVHSADITHRLCRLSYDRIAMSVYTDLPGMHFYTGNYLDGKQVGKKQASHGWRTACCFETQFYPDSINNHERPDCLLLKETTYAQTTIFQFDLTGTGESK